MNKSCHTYTPVVSSQGDAAGMYAWHTYELAAPWRRAVERHVYEWVVSHIWMSHVTRVNEVYHRCECVVLRMWKIDSTHTYLISLFCVWNESSTVCEMSHTDIHTYIHTYIPAQSLVRRMNQSQCVEWIVHSVWNESYRHTYIHTCIHTYIHTYIHTSIHPSIHPYIHTYIHPSIHPSIHAYIHTHIPAQSLVRRTNHPHTHTWRVSSFHTHLPQEPLQSDAVAALISLLAALTTHEVNDLSMTHSTENATTPKSTKFRNSKSLVQIQIQPTSDFGFVPRGTEQSEFLDFVDFWSVAISVETVILSYLSWSLSWDLLQSLITRLTSECVGWYQPIREIWVERVHDLYTHMSREINDWKRHEELIWVYDSDLYQRDISRESPWLQEILVVIDSSVLW